MDYVKCDDICNTNIYPNNPYSAKDEIEMLHEAIMKTGRPIVLSLSPGPALIDKAWHYEKYANLWRITDDLWDKIMYRKAAFQTATCVLSAGLAKDSTPINRHGIPILQKMNSAQ